MTTVVFRIVVVTEGVAVSPSGCEYRRHRHVEVRPCVPIHQGEFISPPCHTRSRVNGASPDSDYSSQKSRYEITVIKPAAADNNDSLTLRCASAAKPDLAALLFAMFVREKSKNVR